jgi:hypothetical protein
MSTKIFVLRYRINPRVFFPRHLLDRNLPLLQAQTARFSAFSVGSNEMLTAGGGEKS